jgi:hypothetical protein
LYFYFAIFVNTRTSTSSMKGVLFGSEMEIRPLMPSLLLPS